MKFRVGKALPVGAFLFVLWLAPAAAAETAHVRHTLDGDSLVLDDGRQVRLIGVNAPEFGHDGRPEQPLARAAQQRLAALTEGRTVTLVFEQERTDRHGRSLAHVRLADGTHVEEVLLREGLAWMIAISPNVAELARLQAAEDEARRQNRGVWGRPEYRPAPAERLTAKDTGFILLSGTVHALERSAHAYHFRLTARVTLLVPREHWQRHFAAVYGRPQALVGRGIVARGWLTEHNGGLSLRLTHAVMLTLTE